MAIQLSERLSDRLNAYEARIAALEAQQESDHAWIDADAKTKEAQQNEIAALEAALEKADALVDLLLDQTLYPMKYDGTLRTTVCNFNEARAKTRTP